MAFGLPVEVVYNGRIMRGMMGPFENSPEREFALTVNKRAIEECSNLEQLKQVSKNLLEGWSSMNTAIQSMMLENIQLRQAMAKYEVDLRAAEEIVNEAASEIEKYKQQSRKASMSLWPFGW